VRRTLFLSMGSSPSEPSSESSENSPRSGSYGSLAVEEGRKSLSGAMNYTN
ncbi:unnamed protein product, partial [Microthlaspi erraticum]